MASSISSSHLHRDRRHPRHRLAYVAAVAIVGLAAETVLLHLTQLSHPPGSYADVRPACFPVRRCLCRRRPGGALQRGPSSPPSRCRCIAVGSSFLSTVIGGCHRCSLSLPGSAPTCRVGTSPPRLLPPPFSAELLAAAARFVPGARCLCLIVVGALAPLCFLFSVFQNARPPATPRRLGPPLTQRSKTLGLEHTSLYFKKP